MSKMIERLRALSRHRTPRARCILLAVSGLLLGLSVCFARGLLEWIALIPVLVIYFSLAGDERVSLRHMYGYGFVFNYAFSLVLFHWFFYMYPLEFIGV